MDQEKRARALKALEKRGISLGGIGQTAKTLGGGALKSLPLIGNVISGGSAIYNVSQGNWGEAALDAAGMLPGIGNAVNIGRLGYGMGKMVGGAQQQQPQGGQPQGGQPQQYEPQAAVSPFTHGMGGQYGMSAAPGGSSAYGHPQYKYAGLCNRLDRAKRGLAFEAGVERFCKEASFDDDDRKAMLRMIVKLADLNDDPAQYYRDKGVDTQNSWLNFQPNEHKGWWGNMYDRISQGFSGPNGGLGKLIQAPIQQWQMSNNMAEDMKSREKTFNRDNPGPYMQQYMANKWNTQSEKDFARRKTEAYGNAELQMKRFPGMSRARAAALSFGGMGAAGRDMSREFRNMGQPAKPPAQFGSAVQGGGGPAAAPPAGGAQPQTMQGGTGYFTGAPPASPTPAQPPPTQTPPGGGGGAGGGGQFGANPMKPQGAAGHNPASGIYIPESMKDQGASGTIDTQGPRGKIYALPYGFGKDQSMPGGNQGGPDEGGKGGGGSSSISPPPGMRIPNSNEATQAGIYTGSHGQVMPGGNPSGQVGVPPEPGAGPAANATQTASTPSTPAAAPQPPAPSLKSPGLSSILSQKSSPAAPAAPAKPPAPPADPNLADDIEGTGTRSRASAPIPDIPSGPLAAPPAPAAPAPGLQEGKGIMPAGWAQSQHKMTSQELADTMLSGQQETAKKTGGPIPTYGANPMKGSGGMGGAGAGGSVAKIPSISAPKAPKI
jgi:hypothetical protein